jgi:hypothetical protein
MATDPPADLALTPLNGQPRTIAEWVTTFHLAIVVVDPFTYESAWLLDEAGRILSDYTAADVRVAWLVTGTPAEARQFLGPWAERLLTFADPDRSVVKALGLTTLPAFVHINMAGKVETAAEGWEPEQWRKVAERLSMILSWTKPAIPGPDAPAAYGGSPALP